MHNQNESGLANEDYKSGFATHIPLCGASFPRKLGSVLQRAFYGSGGCVTLYELRNFSGRRLAVTSDCPKLSECNFPERCNSVQVESGAWVGYEGENYSGRQYLWDVYDKREYSNYDKWLGTSDHISSVRAVREECSPSKICLYEKPGFSGRKVELQEDIPNLISRFSLNRFASARVLGGVWVVYQDPNYRGLHYILEKRDFNNCTEWGATAATVGSIRRIRFH
uniref:crystallin beta gamma X n=1 Tax=Pristiophorus japonicus TaxID=55135 RepID=UPI00398F6D39